MAQSWPSPPCKRSGCKNSGDLVQKCTKGTAWLIRAKACKIRKWKRRWKMMKAKGPDDFKCKHWESSSKLEVPTRSGVGRSFANRFRLFYCDFLSTVAYRRLGVVDRSSTQYKRYALGSLYVLKGVWLSFVFISQRCLEQVQRDSRDSASAKSQGATQILVAKNWVMNAKNSGHRSAS